MKSERGQTLILFVGVLTVVFVMAAVVIDVGLWLAERREVQRAADLAAAAGAQDLLVNDGNAVTAAYEWAERNGFENGVGGATVNAELLCYNTTGAPPSAICSGTGSAAPCDVGQHCDSLRVEITKPATILFSGIFGISSFDIEASSAAGLTVQSVPTDTVILMDATGSMATVPCVIALSNPGCRMKEARDASNQFVDILLGGLNTASRVGFAAYNHCYNPPLAFAECMTSPSVVPMTSNAGTLHTAITNTTPAWCTSPAPAHWCGGTNICVAIDKAAALLSGSSAARKNVVLLTDGEGSLFLPDPVYPSAQQCRPPGGISTPGCATTETNEAGPNGLDNRTYQKAQTTKAQSVEIYVIGLQVCGTNTGTTPNCAAIGTLGESDSVADRRLLKCIASSPAHYVEISNASQIPDAFREIAAAIVSRGLLE